MKQLFTFHLYLGTWASMPEHTAGAIADKLHVLVSKVICIVLLSLAIPAAAYAHSGSIKGLVYDGNSNKPMEGVSIYIKAIDNSAVTDAFGKFFMKGITPGRYKISISHIGFDNIDEEVKIEDGVTTDLTYNMGIAPVEMKSVSVNARKDLNLSSISGLDLNLRPVNNTQDLMRLVPGLFTAQHQGGGKAEQIFLRGFDCDHGTDINVSVDNIPVNMVSHAHGQGFADAHFIIPEAVQEVDYGKGPYQIDKGNLCTAGYVGFKTKNSLDNSFVKADGGMYGYFRTAAGISLLNRKETNDHQDAYILGEYGYNRSYFDASQNFNRFNLMGKYTNYISSNKILSLTLSGFNSNWDALGQIPTRAVNEGIVGRYGGIDPEGGATSRYNMNLQYFQAINSNSYIKSNIYLTYYQFSLFSDFTYLAGDSVNGDQIHQAEKRVLAGYNNEYTTNYTAAHLKTKTQLGIGFRYDDITGDELTHTLGRTTILNPIAYGDIHETNIYGYANQTVYLLPQLVLTLGTRFDNFIQQYDNRLPNDNTLTTFNNSRFSPKAGLYYNFGDNARVYYNYGTGFHTNDTRTLVLGKQLGSDVIIDHSIPAAHSHDLGLIIKPNSKLLLSGAVWMMDMQQEFGYSGDAAVVDTSGRTRRYGVDISARYELLKWLYLDVDVNYAHGRAIDQPKGQNYIPLAPSLTSIGGVTFKMNKNTTASLRYRHISDRPANDDNTLTALGYTVFDAVINYSRPHYELGMQIQNLFNTQWNEAQFATETRLRYTNGMLEPKAATDVCYTPGIPFFLKFSATYKF
ncbi:MAG: TonB-dependent receptor [Flavipsychrobacter sp.]|nr:TonB-dependent receptor [Flavipsychrobacter sp.]